MFSVRTVVFFLLFILIASLVGLVVLYYTTRCPGGTLSICQMGYMNTCGSPNLQSASDCESFVAVEDCYCDKCKFCLGSDQHTHCLIARAERLKQCKSSF